MAGTNFIGQARPGAIVLWEHPELSAGGQSMPVLALGEAGDGRTIALSVDSTDAGYGQVEASSSHASEQAANDDDSGVAESTIPTDDAGSTLPEGTDAPAQADMSKVAVAATAVSMPSAEALIAAHASADAQPAANDDVGKVVAEVLSEDGGQAVDGLLAAIVGAHDGAQEALQALASADGHAVPGSDSGGFAGFTAAQVFSMEALALHPDASATQHA